MYFSVIFILAIFILFEASIRFPKISRALKVPTSLKQNNSFKDPDKIQNNVGVSSR